MDILPKIDLQFGGVAEGHDAVEVLLEGAEHQNPAGLAGVDVADEIEGGFLIFRDGKPFGRHPEDAFDFIRTGGRRFAFNRDKLFGRKTDDNVAGSDSLFPEKRPNRLADGFGFFQGNFWRQMEDGGFTNRRLIRADGDLGEPEIPVQKGHSKNSRRTRNHVICLRASGCWRRCNWPIRRAPCHPAYPG